MDIGETGCPHTADGFHANVSGNIAHNNTYPVNSTFTNIHQSGVTNQPRITYVPARPAGYHLTGTKTARATCIAVIGVFPTVVGIAIASVGITFNVLPIMLFGIVVAVFGIALVSIGCVLRCKSHSYAINTIATSTAAVGVVHDQPGTPNHVSPQGATNVHPTTIIYQRQPYTSNTQLSPGTNAVQPNLFQPGYPSDGSIGIPQSNSAYPSQSFPVPETTQAASSYPPSYK
ncbi:uncharacterized protein LOC143458935 [Clavelina lepadiformis]|uniref:Uncharacterized protein n=1 Tax=Clavelina lepadiformis TaxID=159417 RepID=A0ABP0FW54_CLALP